MNAVWKGVVGFGLVSVPVKMYSASHAHEVPLRLLHRDTLQPVRYIRTCEGCPDELSWDEIVRGYEYEKDQYVTFEKEELESLTADLTRDFRIREFVRMEEIDPIYLRKTYYLSPEEGGERAYTLLARALEETDKAGLAVVTIRTKTRPALIRSLNGRLSLTTMNFEEEIVSPADIPGLENIPEASRAEVETAKLLIGQLTADFNPGQFEDQSYNRLIDAIQSKIDGGKPEVPAAEPQLRQPEDLMEALRGSLDLFKPSMQIDRGNEGSVSDKRKPPSGKGSANKSGRTGAD
ncbi:non-homologous end joining protein Ku [Saccharibacillus kuerlensis]|uniref:Non-homologous end joining protein Ku n=1 Tax=Saccharibacillus kuerlensis TaxID=459527 RepID=A0ABQ2L5K9_9BACL|nr:Ku protein [Saccharibacillus kuerlensis]GGO02068.1 non-homologous end joining protein Ku [Saccharibacillus kuerlensis]